MLPNANSNVPTTPASTTVAQAATAAEHSDMDEEFEEPYEDVYYEEAGVEMVMEPEFQPPPVFMAIGEGEEGDRVLFEARGVLFRSEKFVWTPCGSGLLRLAFHPHDPTPHGNNGSASDTNPNSNRNASAGAGAGAGAEASASSVKTGETGEPLPLVLVGGVRLLMRCEGKLTLNQWLLRASRFERHADDRSAIIWWAFDCSRLTTDAATESRAGEELAAGTSARGDDADHKQIVCVRFEVRAYCYYCTRTPSVSLDPSDDRKNKRSASLDHWWQLS